MKRLLAAVSFIVLGATGFLAPSANAVTIKAGPPGYRAVGEIHPSRNPNWCLTAPVNPIDGDPVFVAPCVKNDAMQQWEAVRVLGIGQVALTTKELNLGQQGTLNTARVVIAGKPSTNKFTVGFSPSHDFYVLSLLGYKNNPYLVVPRDLKKGVYKLSWSKLYNANTTEDLWIFPRWQEVTVLAQ